jgi:hypothetical protein
MGARAMTKTQAAVARALEAKSAEYREGYQDGYRDGISGEGANSRTFARAVSEFALSVNGSCPFCRGCKQGGRQHHSSDCAVTLADAILSEEVGQ